MKIYPNRANIVATKEVNLATDIPLSYIDTNAVSYDINFLINDGLNTSLKKEVLPYDKLDKLNLCLFDKNANLIPYNEMLQSFKRDGKDYVYIPKGSKSFVPKTFLYDVIAKKNIKYLSNNPYNLKVLVPNNPSLANSLMSICGDAPKRLLAPGNISINNGDLAIDSLTNGNMINSDFVFFEYANFSEIIESHPYFNDDFLVKYNPERALDNVSTNIVMVMKESFMTRDYSEEEYDEEDLEQLSQSGDPVTYEDPEMGFYEEDFETLVQFRKSKDKFNYKIKNPILYENITIETNKYFTIPKNTATSVYHNLFDNTSKTPILVEEIIGKGFLIYMPENIIKNAMINSKLIYEVMMNIYLNAYLRSNDNEEWIADKMPDFLISNKKLIKKDKFLSNIELYKMFDLSEGEVDIYSVNINESLYPFAKYKGLKNNYLVFEKDLSGENIKYADLEKPKDAISIYTQNKTIMYYDDFIYSIVDNLEDCVNIERVDNEVIVELKPYRNSLKGIYIKNNLDNISIPLVSILDNDTEEQMSENIYYLVTRLNDSASYFEVINSNQYTADESLLNLGTITIKQNRNSNYIYDMRQRGGGLLSSAKDNENCFDIGHVLGRPYRKNNTMIITLPASLKNQKDLILDTVKLHCVAEDYPIIIFKED